MNDSTQPKGTALVTGAGVRVGRAIALELASFGYNIIVHANRSKEAAEKTKQDVEALGAKAHVILADLSNADELERLALAVQSHVGDKPLDVLVNNAALFESIPFKDITRAQYQRMFAVNLDAPFFLTQALLTLLHKSDNALVVNICDIMHDRAPAKYAHYILTKAGIDSLTKSLAVELAPNIRVNAVSPGAVEWPADYSAEKIQRLSAQIPLGEPGENADVAQAVRYLCEAKYVTGQNIYVCGGRSVTH